MIQHKNFIVVFSTLGILLSIMSFNTGVYGLENHESCTTDTDKRPNSTEYLYHFNCGNLEKEEGVRHFTLIAEENQIINISNIGHQFNAWTFNGTVPGPTMRMVEGDHV